ncbi:flavin reductase (DIM6/NTAB) family NADH-FMN oxidoreductase RutF [Arthrobacter silviterrae]|uniref:Flavin reductase family protein n=1 Tax=Arthrobacter silviterrae TaxID=2026658 RepID=A0ABX0DEF1_9MICC|nr:flavin reductase family protein [Arthrobacter silviterrae]MDQ0277431.1 flavin reductase (DIM6/NTAB) family NADH-FMN oxidoreductase RutF [Arthrobacter silviterrae]NGN85304.1 flavin reductase family protein [Arthrobacter silviterrae]
MITSTVLRPVDPAHFRAVMRHLPTGVVAICATDPVTGTPSGLVVGSFQSLSLEPALVTFSVTHTSTSWPKISRAQQFSVNLLAEDQQSVCGALSSKSEDKFASINWHESSYGSPHITGSLGWIDCRVEQEIVAGDHLIVIAAVQEMTASDGGDPLVFHGGQLGGFRQRLAA